MFILKITVENGTRNIPAVSIYIAISVFVIVLQLVLSALFFFNDS